MAVKLVAAQTTILPNPSLSDSVQPLSTVNLRRTMGGSRVTYVKSRGRKKYLWTFKLSTEKAWELRAFVKEYSSRVISIIDWNDNILRGYIRSNPIEFNHAQYDPLCHESVEVTLEFEVIS